MRKPVSRWSGERLCQSGRQVRRWDRPRVSGAGSNQAGGNAALYSDKKGALASKLTEWMRDGEREGGGGGGR